MKVVSSQWSGFSKNVFCLTLCAVLFALCVSAEAQQAKVHRIGVLTPRSPSDSAPWHRAFREGLHDLGWVEGKNIAIEYRYAQGNRDRLPDLAAELLRLKVEVVVVVSVLRGPCYPADQQDNPHRNGVRR